MLALTLGLFRSPCGLLGGALLFREAALGVGLSLIRSDACEPCARQTFRRGDLIVHLLGECSQLSINPPISFGFCGVEPLSSSSGGSFSLLCLEVLDLLSIRRTDRVRAVANGELLLGRHTGCECFLVCEIARDACQFFCAIDSSISETRSLLVLLVDVLQFCREVLVRSGARRHCRCDRPEDGEKARATHRRDLEAVRNVRSASGYATQPGHDEVEDARHLPGVASELPDLVAHIAGSVCRLLRRGGGLLHRALRCSGAVLRRLLRCLDRRLQVLDDELRRVGSHALHGCKLRLEVRQRGRYGQVDVSHAGLPLAPPSWHAGCSEYYRARASFRA